LFIDSHAHLDSPRYSEDRADLLRRAQAAGVGGILAIGLGEGPHEMQQALEICRQYNGQSGMPQLWASAGIYPHNTHEIDQAALAKLDRLLAEPEVIACGELGLDYYHEGTPHEMQHRGLVQQLEIAAARKRPITIHCRPKDGTSDAFDDLFPVLDEHWQKTGLGGILHCFSGNEREARRLIEMGFLISFSGSLTFPKAEPLRAVAATLPLDHLLVETDAPWLAPSPHRGQRNESAWVLHTAHVLAECLGIEADQLASSTTKNFYRLFSLTPNVGN
jgi:TatD DNase family protein